MWQYAPTNELMHYGKIGMRWGKRNGSNSETSHGPRKKLKKGTKVLLATVSVAAIVGSAYVGQKYFNKTMLKGAEKMYNQSSIRDTLSEVQSIKNTTLKDFMTHNKKEYDMGKLYFIRQGFKS